MLLDRIEATSTSFDPRYVYLRFDIFSERTLASGFVLGDVNLAQEPQNPQNHRVAVV